MTQFGNAWFMNYWKVGLYVKSTPHLESAMVLLQSAKEPVSSVSSTMRLLLASSGMNNAY